MLIRYHLTNESSFAAFKRWIVIEKPALFKEFQPIFGNAPVDPRVFEIFRSYKHEPDELSGC